MTVLDTLVPRLGRTSAAALGIATVSGVALVAAGFLVPMYESTGASSSAGTTHGSATLVEVNGPGVVLVLAVPLLVAMAVGYALWHGSRRGAVAFARTSTAILAALNLLAMLSIGVLVLPVTAALIVACATSRAGQPGGTGKPATVG